MATLVERFFAKQKEASKSLPEFSVYIPRDKEQEYCKQNNIVLRRFMNGATLIGAFRDSPDRASASMVLDFPDGGYNDPTGKEGASHLLEHLLVYPVDEFAKESNTFVNATTSATDVKISLEGNANVTVKKHGVWPVIPHLFHTLFTFMRDVKDLPQKLATEKEIVYEEMAAREGPEERVAKFFLDKVYDPKNPKRYEPLGTKDSIANLQVSDVTTTLERIMIPDKVIASVFVDGNEKARDDLIEEVSQHMQQFPQTEQKRKQVDNELPELINPALIPGSIFEQQVEGLSPEGAIDVNYVWVFPVDQFSTDAIAATHVNQLLHKKFFHYMREQGISYIQDVFSDQLKHSRITGFHFRAKKTPGRKEKILRTGFPDIYEQVLSKITEEDLENLHERSQLDLEANPVSLNTRFHTALHGLRDADRIIDPDKIKELAKKVTIDDYKKYIKRLTTTLPATILAGDIKDEPKSKTIPED